MDFLQKLALSLKLLDIDSIMHFAIAQEATPGGQVLIARRGNVIYSKEFGHHTYAQSTPWSGGIYMI